ncbi:XRE family transcriptional regulator [Pandoraea captiosa]|uniref:XRE family transcriptional regulator n=2 Tax=Pandoraea captiosa TaxID=2508302 RepID=A0A5E4ZJ77_9BURK|nr:XRE family transcriptional regulator [Pandoraea captiosa]VVE60572.1 XRE family transcriptional regulator [Pandoraea captiosa]
MNEKQPGTALSPIELGQRLRTARKRLGWTLTQLAEKCDVSITTISRAERGQLALGYENLTALGRALGIDLGSLLSHHTEDAQPTTGPVVTRAGEGAAYRGLSFTYEFLAPNTAGKPFEPVLGTVHAREFGGPQDYARHDGHEFVYVLTGEIDVYFETGDKVTLRKGDSLYFDSRIGHAYVTVSKQLAKVVGAITDESEHIAFARQGHPQIPS